MGIELFNQPKFRSGARPGDDVPLVVPGLVHGVFDGATDVRGTVIDGVSAGRLAALTVARAMTEVAADEGLRTGPLGAIMDHLTAALAARTGALDLQIPPSTTVAAVLDCGDAWRMVVLGDTGIRIDGGEVLRHQKHVDTVSATARVHLFRHLSERAGEGADPDGIEAAARRGIYFGFDTAVAEDVIDAGTAEAIIARTVAEAGPADHAGAIAGFVRGGIQHQHRLGNDASALLGFDTMNGTPLTRGETFDIRRPKAEVSRIEIFSDGYPDVPAGTTVADWEASHRRAEAEDPHKTGAFAQVKGSTREEFFDDRTVLILDTTGA